MWRNLVIILGGIALLAATLVDTVAVILRHLNVPFSGSIEAMQAIVLVSGVLGLVVATWDDAHARVKLLVERLRSEQRNLADLISDLLTLVFVTALLAGSLWLTADLWHGHEQSEVLGVPWAILRIIANFGLLLVIFLLVLRMAGRLKR